MRKITFVLFFIMCFIFCSNISAKAFSLGPLSISKSSERWQLKIGKMDNDSRLSKPKPGVANMYSLDVKNLGKDVYNLDVDIYSNYSGSKTLRANIDADVRENTVPNNEMHFSNFPVSVKAKSITVIITWQEELPKTFKDSQKLQARKYKEIFVFDQK
ncbi:hypothetical protein COD02_28470 [Bacillus thuringiensis]|uniref:hypothetical protein n=1 Tax=Bacillus thuringiensis TaxID=1428 RepID=UPI000BFBF31F|nr:hypothetical protein [Bacillus thuringiensis]PGS79339.1 hypothetical protein COD02_28470 [Bacillus thuringiensis]